MAKYIVCPYCKKKIEFELIRSSIDKKEHVDMLCPGCRRRLAFSVVTKRNKGKEQEDQRKNTGASQQEALAELKVVENVFGFSAIFPLYEGLNRVGRYNDKHTDIEVAIRSSDPSLDRNHSLITVQQTNAGVVSVIMDDDSMTGTFVNTRELSPGERHTLVNGDVITLGATTLIYLQK